MLINLTRREKRRWRKAYEWALEYAHDSQDNRLSGYDAANYADSVIQGYRRHKVEP